MKQFSFSKFISHIYLSDQQQIMILAIGFFIIFIAIFVILRIFSDETVKRVLKLRDDKYSVKEILEMCNISSATYYRIIKAHSAV